jgi:hypothetical protein
MTGLDPVIVFDSPHKKMPASSAGMMRIGEGFIYLSLRCMA